MDHAILDLCWYSAPAVIAAFKNVKTKFLLVDELIFARLVGSKAIKRNVGTVIVILDHPSERFIEVDPHFDRHTTHVRFVRASSKHSFGLAIGAAPRSCAGLSTGARSIADSATRPCTCGPNIMLLHS